MVLGRGWAWLLGCCGLLGMSLSSFLFSIFFYISDLILNMFWIN
jgi:hypothetical protein